MNYFRYLLNTKKKILIFGNTGQLGITFKNQFGSHPNILVLGSSHVNFLNPETIPHHINYFNPDIIINTSAYTNVDQAEKNHEEAFIINGEALKYIGQATKENEAILVHFSTDYIFDGNKTSKYKPNDIPNPINTYGKSKFVGEQNIINSGCNFFIFRISWLMSEYGNNFIKKIIQKIINNEDLFVVNDQIGTQISTNLVAKITCEVLSLYPSNKPKKIFHLSTKGTSSWFDIAVHIFDKIALPNNDLKIYAIKSDDINCEVKRPKNSLFDHSDIEKIIKSKLPGWKDDLNTIIKKLN